jgi:hypothetical protein
LGGALQFVSATPTLAYSWFIAPAASSVSLLGGAPSVREDVTVPAGALALQSSSPELSRTEHQFIEAAAASVRLDGALPTVDREDHRTIAPVAGVLTLTGRAPNLTFGGQAVQSRRRSAHSDHGPRLLESQRGARTATLSASRRRTTTGG